MFYCTSCCTSGWATPHPFSNTPAFHAYASERKSRNQINGIMNDEDFWVTNEKEVALVVENYFKHLFCSSRPSEPVLKKVIDCVPLKLSGGSRDLMDAPYSSKEVHKAIFDMHPTKAPGSDGLPGRFFQRLWPEIGEDITEAILQVLNKNGNLKSWNSTLIVLIPKIDNPMRVKDFRPISLCNTIYKVVSKVIANRLKKVLHEVVDENQSAFVAGRQITDNIMVAFECMHWINNAGSRQNFAALKLDMSKAFDRVEWSFLNKILAQMNFPISFINLIMNCISSVSYSCVINGGVYGSFTPSRGLRQGDPLSPLLFILCSQGFSSILNHLSDTQELKPICFGDGGPRVSHLFFADDSMLFLKAEEEGCEVLQRWIKFYELASGQKINLEKSAICFSKHMQEEKSRRIQAILGVNIVEKHDIYLGLPTVSCRSKRIQFGYLRDRALRKLASWKNKKLSAGGKEVLIKSIIQSIPTYAMQCFKIPISICYEIERACAKFWWGEGPGTSRMHWQKWSEVCRPKAEGGLGFRSLVNFNKALLAKQVWRLETKPNSLIARVFKAKYFRDSLLGDTVVGSAVSFIWRSLCWARPVLQQGTMWRVGNGDAINLFTDNFVPDLKGGSIPNMENLPSNTKVSKFITDQRAWDVNKLILVVGEHMANIIKVVPISPQGEDRCCWSLSPKRNYSVKSGYLSIIGYFNQNPTTSTSSRTTNWNRLVWHVTLPPKFRIFQWRLLHDFVANPMNLLRHHVPVTGLCEMCKKEWGSTVHCLYLCKEIKETWKYSVFWVYLKNKERSNMMEIGTSIQNNMSKDNYAIWCITSYFTWLYICTKKHNSDGQCMRASIEHASSYLTEFKTACRSTRKSNSGIRLVGERVWKPPQPGIYRLDVDVVVDMERDVYGYGAVVRDSNGGLIAALAKKQGKPNSILEAKINAIVASVEWCIRERLKPISVFTDSMAAVKLMNNRHEDGFFMEPEFYSIAEALQTGSLINFTHVYRSSIVIAHSLARFGARSDNLCTWNNYFPQWLRDLVNA